MSLGLRLALLVFLAAVPIFAYETYAELDRRDERRRESAEQVTHLAALIATSQGRMVDSARYLLSALARLDSVMNARTAECEKELEAIRQELPDVTGIGVLRPDGRSFCGSTPGSNPVDLSDRPYVREALRTKEMASSGYIVGRITGRGTLNFVLPALDEEGKVRAIVLAAYSTANLSKELSETTLPQNAVVTVFDPSGTIVARSLDEKKWIGQNFQERPFIERVYAAERGTIEGTGPDGVDRFYGFARIKAPANLSVMVGLPRDGLFAEADRRLREEIAVLAVIVLMAAALAFAFAEYGIRRPIVGLERAVDRFVRGETDHVEPRRSGVKELVGLSRHLGAMSAELHARQEELRQAVAQKEMLLREVNHRVKNSLQVVASLFSLHGMAIKDPEARRQFAAASKQVATVARVHQRLYEGADVDRVDFGPYLRELCDDLAASLGRAADRELICEADDLVLPTDKVVPLALIVNELITNAFKHTVEDRPPKVFVRFRRERDGALRLTVRDNGPGLKDGTGEAAGRGLGLRMVSALAHQLRGTLDVDTSPEGTTFTVEMTAT